MREKRSVILQTCLPDYRLSFFRKLCKSLATANIVAGREFFSAHLNLPSDVNFCRVYTENKFYFSKALLWQSGITASVRNAEVVVAEFNPRILSTWFLLLVRRLSGQQTLLWGHLWGHLGPVWMSRKVRILMLRLSTGMITYSHSQAKEFSRLFPHLPVWVAANSCVSRDMCISTDVAAGEGCIVYVGRLVQAKKPVLLLEAFALALTRLPVGTKLVLVGEGPLRDSLLDRASALNLDGRLELLGHVSDEAELRRVYERSRVAVSPGYVGLSAIQSMAYGVPMLVSRDEPHSPEIEACVEGETCEFFNTDNVYDLAEHLIGFYCAGSSWDSKRSRISRFISENYTIEGMVDAFVEAVGSIGNETELSYRSKAALVWAQYGPYHLARLKALRAWPGCDGTIGVEIASKTQTYAWSRGTDVDSCRVTTLIEGKAVESVSALETYLAARRIFQELRCNVVFVPSYWPASSLAVNFAARSMGAKVVMMNDSHALTAKARGALAWVKHRIISQYDAALVAGAPQRSYFTQLGMPADKIVTGYDVVDNDYFVTAALAVRDNATSVRKKHGLPERYLINIGRMEWKKNLGIMVDAYVLLRSRLGSDCPKLVFVGSGRQEAALRDRCLASKLSIYECRDSHSPVQRSGADVFFLGFRQVDELPEFYALAEAFILPSREEEWGLVVNEAMACGLPVVVSKVAGCAPDLVHHGVNGYQFDPAHADELASQLEAMATDPILRARMGEESRRIIQNWGCERFAAGAGQAIEIAMGKGSIE